MSSEPRLPREVRAEIRAGRWSGVTAGLCPAYAQANLVALPAELAGDFLEFCRRNPQACPVLEVTEVGAVEPVRVAPGADLSTDLPRYRIYQHGALIEEVIDASGYWRADLVAFLLGCSFTLEWALLEAGIPLWHIEQGRNVAMWRTTIECEPAGVFRGPLVVSMRPIPASLVELAVRVSARFPSAHGAPIHIGDPGVIGIQELASPDWGDPQEFTDGDVPVFWACGVTPQAVAIASRVSLMITHSPGHMFITDVPLRALEVATREHRSNGS